MKKYVCTGCYSVYDPLIGDEDAGIESGTDFEEVPEEFRCGICLAPKESFLLLPENLQEAIDPEHLLNKESEHIPRYAEQDGFVFVRLGDGDVDAGFPCDDEHHLTTVWLFDEDGEPIEWRVIDREKAGMWYRFDLPDDGYEVRADCNLHGTWKGIFDATILEDLPKDFEEIITKNSEPDLGFDQK